jgi:hypothetical protein
MLELHLYQVGGILIARHVSQPVVGVQLAVLSPYSLMAQASVASHLYDMFFFFHYI